MKCFFDPQNLSRTNSTDFLPPFFNFPSPKSFPPPLVGEGRVGGGIEINQKYLFCVTHTIAQRCLSPFGGNAGARGARHFC